MRTLERELSGWGRYPKQVCQTLRPERYGDLLVPGERQIVRGMGRSYGDASLLQEGIVTLEQRLNRILSFDAETGVLRAEAGVTLAEILPIIVPRGWFLPVTPGTKFVTLGGCVASDVHGKNHHVAGSFAQHLLSLEMILADGRRLNCSANDNAELFWATVGGMGLTGIIGEVTLQLIPIESAYMQVEQQKAKDLEQVFKQLEPGASEAPYQVAWIDCLARGRKLGRSVVMNAAHTPLSALKAKQAKQPLANPKIKAKSMPIDLPGWALNSLSVKAFNSLYYQREGRRGRFISHYEPYFYPLDHIHHWNRLYGKRGFVQYQCVLPLDGAYDGMARILNKISKAGYASFLSVLKRMGAENPAMLSFPMEGYTLALDLPLKGEKVFSLLNELDEIVIELGGRVYLTKDARLTAENFQRMYPRLAQWQAVKQNYDPEGHFSSSMAMRLGLSHE